MWTVRGYQGLLGPWDPPTEARMASLPENLASRACLGSKSHSNTLLHGASSPVQVPDLGSPYREVCRNHDVELPTYPVAHGFRSKGILRRSLTCLDDVSHVLEQLPLPQIVQAPFRSQ